MTSEKLGKYLWKSAEILRKSLNASENSKPVLILLFLKRLNDVFEENAQQLIKNGLSKTEAYRDARKHTFFIPEDARWNQLRNSNENIGQKIIKTCKIIELVNPKLAGTMSYSEFHIKEKFPDASLQDLISYFSIPLGNNDLENEDVFVDVGGPGEELLAAGRHQTGSVLAQDRAFEFDAEGRRGPMQMVGIAAPMAWQDVRQVLQLIGEPWHLVPAGAPRGLGRRLTGVVPIDAARAPVRHGLGVAVANEDIVDVARPARAGDRQRGPAAPSALLSDGARSRFDPAQLAPVEIPGL